jgi:hypothetical protein
MRNHAKNFTNVIVHKKPISLLFSRSEKKAATEPTDEYRIYTACPAFTGRHHI